MAIRSRNILSLCAGVGGLELGINLALDYLGEVGRGVCYVEREAAAAASLVASMEGGWFHPAPVWSDMLTFDARPWRGLVHILASGDPCQDNSVAGKRAGSEGKRFLAPEVCRIAKECRPNVIFRENVPGNADGQLAAIVPPLERLGYSVAAGIFSSARTRNSMRRERLIIMAERKDLGHERSGPSWRWGNGFADVRCELAYATSERPGEAGGGRGRSAERAGRPDRELGGAQGIGRGKGRPEPTGQQGRCAVAGASSAMDGTLGSGRWREDNPSKPSRLIAQTGGRLPPAVMPGPSDHGWIDLLDRWPEYQPALSKEEAESHLRRGVDAMAHRIERLRATGNGVDPLVAATAFLSLGATLAAGRSAGEFVLMDTAA